VNKPPRGREEWAFPIVFLVLFVAFGIWVLAPDRVISLLRSTEFWEVWVQRASWATGILALVAALGIGIPQLLAIQRDQHRIREELSRRPELQLLWGQYGLLPSNVVGGTTGVAATLINDGTRTAHSVTWGLDYPQSLHGIPTSWSIDSVLGATTMVNGEAVTVRHSLASLNPGEAYAHYFAFDWPEIVQTMWTWSFSSRWKMLTPLDW
jgi:hypothetical protein